MNPDAMLVEPECLGEAISQVAASPPESLQHLGSQEPVLAGFIRDKLATVGGELALAGAPTELIQGVHRDTLIIILGVLQALRRGHYKLWRECVPAERLPDPTPPGPMTEKRGCGGEDETSTEPTV